MILSYLQESVEIDIMKQSLALATVILLTAISPAVTAADGEPAYRAQDAQHVGQSGNTSGGQGIRNDAVGVKQGIKRTAKQIRHGVKTGVKNGAAEVKRGVKETFR